jgi:hypothetical protein
MVKPRPDQKTVTIVDEYCSLYRDLFPEVRSYEYFNPHSAPSTVTDQKSH